MGLIPTKPPPVFPLKPGSFTSSLRTERGTTIIGFSLAACVLICFLTGMYSHFQQNPVDWFTIPALPSWLYRVSQGLHVATGLAAIPLLLLKLWSVYPRLFQWPPLASIANGLERLLIFTLVATMIFQLATGTLNTTQWYPWSFPFVSTHYAVSFVILGVLLAHIGTKYWNIRRALRSSLANSRPITNGPVDTAGPEVLNETPFTSAADDHEGSEDESDHDDDDDQAGLSRRGLLVTGGLAVGAVTATTVGQTLSPVQDVAALAPRIPDIGPQNIPVNRTAQAAGITDEKVAAANYRLTVQGPENSVALSLTDLAAMDQYEVQLPISCVEGWSASALWTGIRIKDFVAMVGGTERSFVIASSIEENWPFAQSEMQPQFAQNDLTLLALQVNGEPLDRDHGYPARIIAPNRPGVRQTKWVNKLVIT